MSAILQRDYLDRKTGLDWTAADGVHFAAEGNYKFKLKREWDSEWTGTVIYRGSEYTVATFSGAFDQVAEWMAKEIAAWRECQM